MAAFRGLENNYFLTPKCRAMCGKRSNKFHLSPFFKVVDQTPGISETQSLSPLHTPLTAPNQVISQVNYFCSIFADQKFFFQFEINIDVLVSSFRFI